MTNRVTTTGIVTKQSTSVDGVRLLSILTPDYGIVKVSVKPKGRSGATNSAMSQFLSFGTFTTLGNKGVPNMIQSEVKDNFGCLQTDLYKLSLATYFADAVYGMLGMNNPDENIYRLFLNSVYALAKLNITPSKVKLAFEMKLCALSGYAPQLVCCSNCGEVADTLFFDTKQGEAYCSICKIADTFKINQEEILLMRYTSGVDLKKLLAFNASNEAIKVVSDISEKYLVNKLGYVPKSLEYYMALAPN